MAMKEGPGASAARLQSEVEEDDYEKGNDYLQKMTPVASSDDVEHQEQLKGNRPVIVYTYLVEWTLSSIIGMSFLKWRGQVGFTRAA